MVVSSGLPNIRPPWGIPERPWRGAHRGPGVMEGPGPPSIAPPSNGEPRDGTLVFFFGENQETSENKSETSREN